MPWDLSNAIEYAHRVLDWMEQLPEDELPPTWMWTLDHELEDWFNIVKQKRDEKYGTTSSSGDRDEIVPLMSNDLAEGRR